MEKEKEKLKEQAERLYLQGLHAFAGADNPADTEGMKRAAGLWQQAWELYIKAGDKDRAKELKKSAKKKARRWVVERTHSWLNRFRGLLIRWCKKAENYLAMLHLACGIITWRACLCG